MHFKFRSTFVQIKFFVSLPQSDHIRKESDIRRICMLLHKYKTHLSRGTLHKLCAMEAWNSCI